MEYRGAVERNSEERKMKRQIWTLAVAILMGSLPLAADAGNRVDICHFPPGNPANFQTITVGEKLDQIRASISAKTVVPTTPYSKLIP